MALSFGYLKHCFTLALRMSRRRPLMTAANIIGLSLGLSYCVIFVAMARHEASVDDWVAGAERVFRVETAERYPGRADLDIARAPGPLRIAMEQQFPEVEAVVRAQLADAQIQLGDEIFTQKLTLVDPDFIDFFGISVRAGSPRLDDPAGVAISLDLAEKIFGTTQDILGRTLRLIGEREADVRVTALFESLPSNSHLVADILVPIDTWYPPAANDDVLPIPQRWNGAYFHTYVRLSDPQTAHSIEEGLPSLTDNYVSPDLVEALGRPASDFYHFSLLPLRRLHFDGAALAAMKPPGDRFALLIYSLSAIAILAMACLNFMAFGLAAMARRRAEFALRRIFGTGLGQLGLLFFAEFLLLMVMAGGLCLALSELALRWLPTMGVAAALSPAQPGFLIWLITSLLLLCLSLAVLPTLVLSARKPADLLRPGHGQRQFAGWRLFDLATACQFSLVVALISVVLIFGLQIRYLSAAPLGFKPDYLLLVKLPSTRAQAIPEILSLLETAPAIDSVALSSGVPGKADDASEANAVFARADQQNSATSLGLWRVSHGFFASYQPQFLAGRDFRQGEAGKLILNESALSSLGFSEPSEAIGQDLIAGGARFQITAVVGDMRFRDAGRPQRPAVFLQQDRPGMMLTIRAVPGASRQAKAALQQAWDRSLPDLVPAIETMPQVLNALYQPQRQQAVMLSVLTLGAIAIAGLGLAGVSALSAQRQSREVVVRKMLGASRPQLFALLAWRMIRPVLLAILIASPGAAWAMTHWLGGFDKRIDLSFWPFLAAGGIALSVAMLMMAGHFWTLTSRRISTGLAADGRT